MVYSAGMISCSFKSTTAVIGLLIVLSIVSVQDATAQAPTNDATDSSSVRVIDGREQNFNTIVAARTRASKNAVTMVVYGDRPLTLAVARKAVEQAANPQDGEKPVPIHFIIHARPEHLEPTEGLPQGVNFQHALQVFADGILNNTMTNPDHTSVDELVAELRRAFDEMLILQAKEKGQQ